MITSCKGGVGKTTLTAGLASQLCALNKSVIAVDMDFGVRSLDLALGFENSICGDAFEFMMQTRTLEDCCVQDASLESLSFMPAPVKFDADMLMSLEQSHIDGFVAALKSRFDFVLLDMPAGFGRLFELIAECEDVDSTLVVCSHNPSSVRAAEKTAFELYRHGKTQPSLIINMFNIPFVKKGYYPGIINIIDRSSVKLAGVVPLDSGIDGMQQNGGIINCRNAIKGNGYTAISNIARRLCGETVSLMSSIIKAKKRHSLL